jgi:helicase MOV-10
MHRLSVDIFDENIVNNTNPSQYYSLTFHTNLVLQFITGKTVTLVESILQLYSRNKKACILVCSSSNSASDHVLVKLLESGGTLIRERDVFRLNATSRPYDDVNPEYLRFCFFDEMVFKYPPLKALMQYHIIVSTYMCSTTLEADGLRRGHFSHIFLDEAGQASEPETVVQ